MQIAAYRGRRSHLNLDCNEKTFFKGFGKPQWEPEGNSGIVTVEMKQLRGHDDVC